MSDIIKRLRETASCADYVVDREIAHEAADTITRLTAEVEWHKKNSDKWQDTQAAHLREVARLTAEVERLKKEIIGRQAHDRMQVREIKHLTAEVERLRAALRECEAELNAYYRMEYPSDHPYSQKKVAHAMASNPATVALKETST